MTLPVAGVGPQQATILVVDDTPTNLEIIGALLQPLYHVRVANSGARALRAARTQPYPDLILLDIMMPDMNGYDVMRALRDLPETRDIPVIFVTAMSGDEEEEVGLDLGASDYITKPVKPNVLLARVRTQLENKQARGWLRDQNDYLEKEVLRRMRVNELSKAASLRATAMLAEVYDKDTGNHLDRTMAYVEVLGLQLMRSGLHLEELAGGRLNQIAQASQLHDIGKVGIPLEILCKPGKLTADEYEVMKSHPRIGAEALGTALRRVLHSARATSVDSSEALGFLRMAQEIAGAHHEKWDGSGYPRGLKGTEIPLAGRMMAIADVFDALTHKRAYKRGYTPAEVDDYMRSGRGTHFDPHLVDAYFEVADEFRAIVDRLADRGLEG